MAQHRTCPNGHRWEDTPAGISSDNPKTLCPVCGALGMDTPPNHPASARQFDETLEPPPIIPGEGAFDETLNPSLSPSNSSTRPPIQNAHPSALDVTLEKPPGPCSPAETLDSPPAKPTGGPRAETPEGTADFDGRRTRERPLDQELTLDLPDETTAPAVPLPAGEEYEILGELGRGGMGMVYKARQVRLNRLVALKMIRAGIHADPMDLFRFQREAEAVAQLHHPNIVQIFEVGDRNGMPFFSLEYVEGGSLQQKLDGTPRPPRQTAALVETLARAMDFAHKQGIVHRDLKPANILLTADGTPKITDFGLAKKLEEADAGQTGTGAILGTPTYMAPEQAQGKNRLIGPPVDIYALGAILYDLLTGRPPFKGETVMDTLMLLQKTEPVPPTRLQPKVPRDLEIICLKCLEKDPARRYGTALELAEDIDRFLNDRPIKARKASAAERAWKWSKRRPAAAALCVVSALALLALGSGGWLFAQREQERAVIAENLKNDAETARDAAVKEQQRAETNLYHAFESVDQLILRISMERLLNEPAMEQVRRDLLMRPLAFYKGFLQENPSNRNVRYDMGRAQRRIAGIYEKLDDPRPALNHYGEAEKILERLAKENPEREEYLQEEARTRIDRAIVLHQLERYDEAEQEHERAASILGGLIRAAGHDPAYRGDLAASYISRAALLQLRNRKTDAIKYYRLAADLLEGLHKQSDADPGVRVKLAGTYINLGILFFPTDRAGAMRLYESAGKLVEPEPDDAALLAQFQRERARVRQNVGVGYRLAGELKLAEVEYAKADEILKALTERFPYTAEFQHLRSATQQNLGELYLALDQPEKERAADELAYALVKPLHEKNPNNLSYTVDLAKAATELGFAVGPTREPNQVLALWGESAAIWQGLTVKHPMESGYRVALGKCRLNRGQLYGREGQTANALREYGEATAVYEALARDLPAERAHLADWIATYENQARTYTFLANGPESAAAWKRATELGKKWTEESPSVAAGRIAYANVLVNWGLELSGRGEVKRGGDLLETALPERFAMASLEANRLDRRHDWHKLTLLVLQRRGEEPDPAGVYRVASGWLADWQKLKPLNGEDPEGKYCVRAAELVGKCMSLIAQDEKLTKEYGDLVMQFLRRAVAGGYRDRAALEGSADLRRLRGRADFAALLKKLAPPPADAP